MNIKSLLLGSAAVLVAASTAQAADAIVVEPEPVEYVRICDAYGSGFFYIPGTETCMNINGYVRSTYDHWTTTTGGVENPDHASWTVRGRLNFDVRNETDWGTLRSQLRLQGG
ncbi:MAG: porin, partial [Rhizobiaceae bacterium]